MSRKLYMEILEGMGFAGERATQAMGNQRIMEQVYREAATTKQAYNFQNTGTKAGGKSVSGGGGKSPAVEVQQRTSLVPHSTLSNAAVSRQQYSQYISQQERGLANFRKMEETSPGTLQHFAADIKGLETNIDMARQSQAVGVGFGEFSQSGVGTAQGRETIKNMSDFNRKLEDRNIERQNLEYETFFNRKDSPMEIERESAFAAIANRKKAEAATFQAESARREAAIARHRTPTPAEKISKNLEEAEAEMQMLSIGRKPEEVQSILEARQQRAFEEENFISSLHPLPKRDPGDPNFMGATNIRASIPSEDQVASGFNMGIMGIFGTGTDKAIAGLGYYTGSAAIGIGTMSLAEGEMSMGSVVGGAMAGVGGGVVGRLAAGSLKGGFLNQGMGAMGRGIGGAADDAYFAGARNTVGSSMTNAANALSGMSDATMTRTMRGMTFAGAGLTGYSMGRDRDHSRGFNSGRGNRF